MLIECLTKREGPTPIDIGKIRYTFMPIPIIDKKTGKPIPGPTTSFAQINMEEHIAYFQDPRRKAIFKEWDGQPRYADGPEKNPMEGYTFNKYGDKTGNPGYIVGHPDGLQFAGADGQWKKTKNKGVIPEGMAPFQTEIDAFTWLKDEVEFQEPEA
jgi:hypothetical protein